MQLTGEISYEVGKCRCPAENTINNNPGTSFGVKDNTLGTASSFHIVPISWAKTIKTTGPSNRPNGMTHKVYLVQLVPAKAIFSCDDLATSIWLYPDMAFMSHRHLGPPREWVTEELQRGIGIAIILVTESRGI